MIFWRKSVMQHQLFTCLFVCLFVCLFCVCVSRHLKVSGNAGSKDMLPKANSLTKLRDVLRRRKAASAESGWKKAPFEEFTKWRPREAGHTLCLQAKGGKKSAPIAVALPGLSPVPLYDNVSLAAKFFFL